MEPAFVDAVLSRFLPAGIPVLAHANGDAAQDVLLAAVERALARAPGRDHRTVVIHAQTTRDDHLERMHALAPDWLAGCRLRHCWFEPMFHKHAGQICGGLQIHVDDRAYDHANFRPWLLQALAFKALRSIEPDYPLWRDFPYEYEHERLAIDLINGSELLRQWVEDRAATPADLDALARCDEAAWTVEREEFLLYR